LDIRVIGNIPLEGCGVGRKRREEVLQRIKQKMAHYDVRGVGSRFSPSGPTVDGNSLETWMAA